MEGGQVNTPGPVRQVSQILQHLIQSVGVDRGIHPAGTVRGHLTKLGFQAGDEAIIGIILAGDVVQVLIVAQPQGDIPGLPVCPSVVGCCGHVVSFD